jgi:hypothetical protein
MNLPEHVDRALTLWERTDSFLKIMLWLLIMSPAWVLLFFYENAPAQRGLMYGWTAFIVAMYIIHARQKSVMK